jgi:hypothetical protein
MAPPSTAGVLMWLGWRFKRQKRLRVFDQVLLIASGARAALAEKRTGK